MVLFNLSLETFIQTWTNVWYVRNLPQTFQRQISSQNLCNPPSFSRFRFYLNKSLITYLSEHVCTFFIVKDTHNAVKILWNFYPSSLWCGTVTMTKSHLIARQKADIVVVASVVNQDIGYVPTRMMLWRLILFQQRRSLTSNKFIYKGARDLLLEQPHVLKIQ